MGPIPAFTQEPHGHILSAEAANAKRQTLFAKFILQDAEAHFPV